MQRPLALLGVALLACGNAGDPPDRTTTGEPVVEPFPPFAEAGHAWPDTAVLEQSGPVTCASPELRELGWWDRTELAAQDISTSLLHGGGMAIADLDGDGLHDLFIPSESSWQLWLQQPDRSWLDASDRLGTPPIDRAAAASAADYDGDGDFDLYIAQDRRRDILLRNDGGWFTDVTFSAGLDARINRSMASSWADWDADGDLDLSVAAYARGEANAFWENQGDGTFSEVFLQTEEWADGMTFQLSWHDLAEDGHPDLFVANDHFDNGPDTALFANQGGQLTEDLPAGYHPNWHGMGVVIADFDGDLVPDVAETSWKDVSLLRGFPAADMTQGLRFVDVSGPWGLAVARLDYDQRFSWGIDAGDLDLDGDMDMVATWGHWEAGEPENQRWLQPDSLWLQEDGVLVEQEPHDYGAGRSVLLVDLDGDGYLDRVKRVLKEPTLVDRSLCGDGSWLAVRVHDHDGSMNRYGIGAKVVVRTTAGSQVRWIEAGSRSMYASGPPEVHFGLDGADVVEQLDVFWPDGRRATFDDLEARQRVTVTMKP